MREHFKYDVFLSHSSTDKPVVRELAERLRRDGLRVWFDEWEIRPGDMIIKRIEEGLEASRVLVLAMSRDAFESEWAGLESGTFRFRDPTNKKRRFIPLRLDDTEIKDALKPFAWVDWRKKSDEQYKRLVAACGSSVESASQDQRPSDLIEREVLSLGHTAAIRGLALSKDGRVALSGSLDNTVRVWDVESGRCIGTMEGHTASVWSVALSEDGRIFSGAVNGVLRIWSLASLEGLRLRYRKRPRTLTPRSCWWVKAESERRDSHIG